ncbi:ATP-binding protein [Nocardioides gilvus]|uniref:ATP-binding protein n=1 Tax=Nocardioides gilvus TaxID=1735589 RepID=UPI000D745D9B|nr:ATP-binding protein [Nocardioides gilvus]
MNHDPGRLRVYLGVAPGVGKTHAMLSEGLRRRGRGTDVVIGLAEPRGRSTVLELAARLETLPALVDPTTGRRELDVAGLLARAPQVALVDDLSHLDPTGTHPLRWRAVQQVLEAGIDVVTCVDIHHLESLSGLVESLTGHLSGPSVPDAVVRGAEQVELVDMTPEALLRRLAHGSLDPPEQIDASLHPLHRTGNLVALRELALLWLADRVEEDLEAYRHQHGVSPDRESRPRVLVAVSGEVGGETLIRRGARISSRGSGELHVVHVAERRPKAPSAHLGRLRAMTDDLGGRWHESVGDDAVETILTVARGTDATDLVVGATHHGRWRTLLHPGTDVQLVAGAKDINVVVVGQPSERTVPTSRRTGSLGARRVWWGALLASTVPPSVAAALSGSPGSAELAVGSMLLLTNVVGCALVGGRWPAVAGAVAGSLSLNWFLTTPQHTLAIDDPVGVISLLLFLVVAVAVASVVDTAVRRRARADRARQEADDLTALNRALMRGKDDPSHLLELLRERFDFAAVALLRSDDEGWGVVSSVGEDPPHTPDEATDSASVSPTLMVAARGSAPLPVHHANVLIAFATHLGAALERQQLRAQSAEVERLREGNRVRTALLAALSHDLRTPLSSIKVAVSGLRDDDVEWSEDDVKELLATIEDSTDRLHGILANLLDLSRLQAGVVLPTSHEVGLDDVVSSTLSRLPLGETVNLEFDDDLPPVCADAGLLERVVANLVDNALRYSPPMSTVTVLTSHVSGRARLAVADHGPGVPDDLKEQMFLPFQRGDDIPGSQGVGLGLAVARGLTEAMGGRLSAQDTPGGGLTMVLDLPTGRPYAASASQALQP